MCIYVNATYLKKNEFFFLDFNVSNIVERKLSCVTEIVVLLDVFYCALCHGTHGTHTASLPL